MKDEILVRIVSIKERDIIVETKKSKYFLLNYGFKKIDLEYEKSRDIYCFYDKNIVVVNIFSDAETLYLILDNGDIITYGGFEIDSNGFIDNALSIIKSFEVCDDLKEWLLSEEVQELSIENSTYKL